MLYRIVMFSKIDTQSRYHQILVHEENANKTILKHIGGSNPISNVLSHLIQRHVIHTYIYISIFLENRTFTKHLESLQISILPFMCIMKDYKRSFHPAKSEKITMKTDFWRQICTTQLGHVPDTCLARIMCSRHLSNTCPIIFVYNT
jgi:hypothetical protein